MSTNIKQYSAIVEARIISDVDSRQHHRGFETQRQQLRQGLHAVEQPCRLPYHTNFYRRDHQPVALSRQISTAYMGERDVSSPLGRRSLDFQMEAVVAEQEIVQAASDLARLFVDGHDSSLIVERESAG